jgi:hypothetical protein
MHPPKNFEYHERRQNIYYKNLLTLKIEFYNFKSYFSKNLNKAK